MEKRFNMNLKCDNCGKSIGYSETLHDFTDGKKVCTSCLKKFEKNVKENTENKKVTEIKCTCNQCGKTWHYLPVDQLQEANKSLQNANKYCLQSTACCGSPLGCLGAVMPVQEIRDFKQCPNCKSRNIKTETIAYEQSTN